jgi:hypothetical protein
MWITRQFRTKQTMEKFLAKNGYKIQWHEIFINNAYGIEYRKLRRVY